MTHSIRVGTRESQLAVWQADAVRQQLAAHGYESQLCFIKSEGDIDLQTPLYAMGVQGIFTRSLDMALLNNKIDIAVHSMKDVPVALARGIAQAAVLPRASYRDILVFRESAAFLDHPGDTAVIATSSIRRKAQWLHRYPKHRIENLRGNVNTRLHKVGNSSWQGAIFAAAGLERIGLRPDKSLDLDWMLPAPAQGAIMVVCREDERFFVDACAHLNDPVTALCTKIERDFLSALLGGCSTPISAYAHAEEGVIQFAGNVFSPDGVHQFECNQVAAATAATELGKEAAREIMAAGGHIIESIVRDGNN